LGRRREGILREILEEVEGGRGTQRGVEGERGEAIPRVRCWNKRRSNADSRDRRLDLGLQDAPRSTTYTTDQTRGPKGAYSKMASGNSP